MSSKPIGHIIRFIGVMLFQVLILNQVNVADGLINPYLYPLIILLLPLSTPSWILMIIALFTGLGIDMFTNTMGLHASALVTMAFFRSTVLRLLTPIRGYEQYDQPFLGMMGWRWFITYASVLILIHHVVFFFLEIFTFQFLGNTVLKILLSSVVSILLAVIFEMIFYKSSSRR